MVKHAEIRELGADTPYWTCAYANEQHNLQAELTDDTDAPAWVGDGWRKFFQMRTSRLILLRPGDVAVLAPGAYHRVFTLKTKVGGLSQFRV